ncbi:MAG: hypothetical protein R3264_10240 [Anaerolineae bacterium]|nr:hypothetical protein [Anaerolineae bacterium]
MTNSRDPDHKLIKPADSPEMDATFDRRRLLKMLAASSGAAAVVALPRRWVTPVIEVGTLPAHAQVSPNPVGLLRIEMTWDTNADMELHCYEQCDSGSFIDVAPKFFGGPTGNFIHHLGDVTGGTGSREVIEPIVPEVLCDGELGIHIGHVTGELPTTAKVTVTTSQGVFVFTRVFNFSGFQNVAGISYPGGSVLEILSPFANDGSH